MGTCLALRDHNLTNTMGDDARIQPGHMQEVLLHETAVAWIRYRLTQTTPPQCWLETREEYTTRIKGVVEDINRNLDVAGLCNDFPERLQQLIDSGGDRLKE